MPSNNPRTLELLIGKLPRPGKITYRRVHSFSDDDLTYETRRRTVSGLLHENHTLGLHEVSRCQPVEIDAARQG